MRRKAAKLSEINGCGQGHSHLTATYLTENSRRSTNRNPSTAPMPLTPRLQRRFFRRWRGTGIFARPVERVLRRRRLAMASGSIIGQRQALEDRRCLYDAGRCAGHHRVTSPCRAGRSMTYGKRTLIAVDQLNTPRRLAGRNLSSRCYRWARDGGERGPASSWTGCSSGRGNTARAVMSEREGGQSPPELRRQE
ncbi:MAG: hypothetical protein ACLRWP_19965 [Bilophila wadsworthia]